MSVGKKVIPSRVVRLVSFSRLQEWVSKPRKSRKLCWSFPGSLFPCCPKRKAVVILRFRAFPRQALLALRLNLQGGRDSKVLSYRGPRNQNKLRGGNSMNLKHQIATPQDNPFLLQKKGRREGKVKQNTTQKAGKRPWLIGYRRNPFSLKLIPPWKLI